MDDIVFKDEYTTVFTVDVVILVDSSGDPICPCEQYQWQWISTPRSLGYRWQQWPWHSNTQTFNLRRFWEYQIFQWHAKKACHWNLLSLQNYSDIYIKYSPQNIWFLHSNSVFKLGGIAESKFLPTVISCVAKFPVMIGIQHCVLWSGAISQLFHDTTVGGESVAERCSSQYSYIPHREECITWWREQVDLSGA